MKEEWVYYKFSKPLDLWIFKALDVLEINFISLECFLIAKKQSVFWLISFIFVGLNKSTTCFLKRALFQKVFKQRRIIYRKILIKHLWHVLCTFKQYLITYKNVIRAYKH